MWIAQQEANVLLSLTSFPSASFILDKMKASNVYVTVTEGKYKGSVGKVIRVERKHYDRHDYFLEIGGKTRKFSGTILKESSSHEVALVYDDDYVKEYKDFNGALIEVGKLIVVTKQSDKTTQQEMILGNVRRIDHSGVHVEPFAINGHFFTSSGKYLRITKTKCALVLDSTTQHSVLINKLSTVE